MLPDPSLPVVTRWTWRCLLGHRGNDRCGGHCHGVADTDASVLLAAVTLGGPFHSPLGLRLSLSQRAQQVPECFFDSVRCTRRFDLHAAHLQAARSPHGLSHHLLQVLTQLLDQPALEPRHVSASCVKTKVR